MPAPLVSAWPQIGKRLASVPLGDFPTAVERLPELERELGGGPLYLKRDDQSSALYGGSKVRALEVLFGQARAAGAGEIIAVGPYGSNQVVATALHAPRCGLRAGAILFSQPPGLAALENLRVAAARCSTQIALPHWSLVPAAIWEARRDSRFIMAPGGATPDAALGYIAAGLELAAQVARGELEAPGEIYLPVGSNCTTAGLMVGLIHGARLGYFPSLAPKLVAVRIAPWPVTSRRRILSLAVRASRRLAELAGEPLELSSAELGQYLRVEGAELGAGYGFSTPAGLEAGELLARVAGLRLEAIYSGKAAAAFVRAARSRREGPLLFWCTKSSAPLPKLTSDDLREAAPPWLAWIRENEQGHTAP